MDNIKCPCCGNKLNLYYKTIYRCDNIKCIMFNAILSYEQWLYIFSLRKENILFRKNKQII